MMDRANELERLCESTLQVSPIASVCTEREIIRVAHALLPISQKLFWLGGLSESERGACSNLFHGLSPRNAIRIVEVELELIYHKFYGGVPPHPMELFLLFICTIFWSLTLCQAYTLSFVNPFTIVLLSRYLSWFFKSSVPSMIFFDWFAIMTRRSDPQIGQKDFGVDGYMYDAIVLISMILVVNHLFKPHQSVFYEGNDHQTDRYELLKYELQRNVSKFLFNYLWQRQGWCHTISRFNLLAYGLRKPRKVLAFSHSLLNTLPVSSREQYQELLGKFIVQELNSGYYDDSGVVNLISFNGQWVLEKRGYSNLVVKDCRFEEIVLQWHLATAILYHACSDTSSSTISDRDKSMLLSDYMGYLLMVQPWIMSKQRGDIFRKSQDALSEIFEIIHSSGIRGNHQSRTEQQQLKEVCAQISKSEDEAKAQAEDKSLSLVHDACDLAANIKSRIIITEKMWEIISEVWVGMLVYACFHSNPMDHIRGLSQGGELATIVWLIMVHAGLVRRENS